VVLDVYRSGGTASPADHFGYWGFALTADRVAFQVPLAAGGGRGSTGGRFTASLTFYHGASPLDTVTDIYSFQARRGPDGGLVITNIAVRSLPLLFY